MLKINPLGMLMGAALACNAMNTNLAKRSILAKQQLEICVESDESDHLKPKMPFKLDPQVVKLFNKNFTIKPTEELLSWLDEEHGTVTLFSIDSKSKTQITRKIIFEQLLRAKL